MQEDAEDDRLNLIVLCSLCGADLHYFETSHEVRLKAALRRSDNLGSRS